MQHSSQQTRRRSPSLTLHIFHRLLLVGLVFTETEMPLHFFVFNEFYLVYFKFYLCFSINCSLVLIAFSYFFYAHSHNFWYSVLQV